MNAEAVQAVLAHSRSANAARMVLIALAARSNGKGQIINLPISELCKDANATDRTVKSAIAELRDELKELKTEGGRGRGQHFDFDISPLLEKVKILHASDKGVDISPIELNGENVAPIPAVKGEDITKIGADISPLSDAKGEDFTGTKVAPYSDLRTSTDKELSLSAREASAEPKREKETKFSREERQAYATARGMKDGWMTLSRDGRYDEVIEGWQQTQTEGAAPAKPPTLTSEELQQHVSTAAEMLKAGDALTDIRARIGRGMSQSQWQHVASTAQAQARVRPKASESPPAAKAANVFPIGGRAAR